MKTEIHKKFVNGELISEKYFINGEEVERERYEAANKVTIRMGWTGLFIIVGIGYFIWRMF